MVYAIVRAGGRQEKVSVGDTIVINRVAGEAGDSIDLAPVLLVDGDKVTSAQAELGKVKVTAEKEDGTKVEFDAVVRIDTPGEADYYRNGGILQYVLRNLMKR